MAQLQQTATVLAAYISAARREVVFSAILAPLVSLAAPGSANAEDLAQVEAPSAERTVSQQATEQPSAARPLAVELAYTADTFAAVAGGARRGTRYLDNLQFVANADLDGLIGLPRTTASASVVYNNGKSFSGDLVGDAQVISSIETGVRAVRLYEAWIEHSLPGDRVSIKAGLYDLNSEFDALTSSLLFIGSAQGTGTDLAQSGRNGPSLFPYTSLAARLQFKVSDQLTLRTAILDGVPGHPDRPRRTVIALGRRDGALLIGEADYSVGEVRLIAGAWHYTARFDNLAPVTAGVPDSGRGNSGAYVRGEAQLTGSVARGLRGFFRLGVANGAFNTFGRFASGGLTWKGLLAGRPDDEAGIAIAWAQAGSDARAAARRAGTTLDRAETVVEATYRLPITGWLSLQPDVQYVLNPGLDPALDNALAVGLRLGITIPFGG